MQGAKKQLTAIHIKFQFTKSNEFSGSKKKKDEILAIYSQHKKVMCVIPEITRCSMDIP
jgi:hypothetical protein